MQKRRLRALVKALRSPQLNRDAFHLEAWTNDKPPETPKLDCGTVCCAIGLGSTLPSWRKADFKMTRGLATWVPQYKKAVNWQAVQDFLDIDFVEARYFFGACSYFLEERNDPLAVANRIEDFISIGGIPK